MSWFRKKELQPIEIATEEGTDRLLWFEPYIFSALSMPGEKMTRYSQPLTVVSSKLLHTQQGIKIIRTVVRIGH